MQEQLVFVPELHSYICILQLTNCCGPSLNRSAVFFRSDGHPLYVVILQDCLRKHPEVLEDLQADKAGGGLQLS